jgi:hypothetical protein
LRSWRARQQVWQQSNAGRSSRTSPLNGEHAASCLYLLHCFCNVCSCNSF